MGQLSDVLQLRVTPEAERTATQRGGPASLRPADVAR